MLIRERATRWRWMGALVAGASLAGGLACGGGGTGPADGAPAVASVAVSPPAAQLAAGATVQLTVVARAADGTEVTGRRVFWASGDTTVAVVSADGLVTARRPGIVPVQAVVDGEDAVAFINVGAVPAAAVAVTPGSAALAVGATAQLAVTVRDAVGGALAGRPVLWRSSDDAVARVTSTGLVSGIAPGAATITATSEAASGSAAITVAAAPTTPAPTPTTPTPDPGGGSGGGGGVVARVATAPATLRLTEGGRARVTATLTDAQGRAVTGVSCTWATNSVTHAAVTAAGATTADVTALKATSKGPPIPGGALRVTATCGGQAGSTTVTITT